MTYLCFNYRQTDVEKITIECNVCSSDDYMFCDVERDEVISSGWLINAAIHINKHHL